MRLPLLLLVLLLLCCNPCNGSPGHLTDCFGDNTEAEPAEALRSTQHSNRPTPPDIEVFTDHKQLCISGMELERWTLAQLLLGIITVFPKALRQDESLGPGPS
jgi:hypothetical protein